MQYDTTQDDRLWGTLAYVLGIFVPLLAPLIIFFVKKDQSRFVAFHALQSLLMDAALLLLGIVVGIISVILAFAHLGLVAFFLTMAVWALGFVVFVLKIIGAIKANGGQLWVAPVVGSFVRQRAAV